MLAALAIATVLSGCSPGGPSARLPSDDQSRGPAVGPLAPQPMQPPPQPPPPPAPAAVGTAAPPPVLRGPADPIPRPAPPARTAAPPAIGRQVHALDGVASYYWQGQMTASGEPFDRAGLTAAHRTLPFGTRVRVTSVATGRSVIVRINDRGPFKPTRVIDISEAAAREIGMIAAGLAHVRVDIVDLPPPVIGRAGLGRH